MPSRFHGRSRSLRQADDQRLTSRVLGVRPTQPVARTVTSVVELQGVSLSYGATEILHAIDLAVADGEFLVVLGPSGSGKTTILRLIGGFLQPSNGRITLDGRDIARVPINRRPFNTVFQDYALFPHMTAAENVGYGLLVRGVGRTEIRERVAKTLALVSLAEFGGRYPAELSGGQQQRIALARAIICEPRLILLDEPLGALDASLRRQMQQFLKSLQREIRTTFLFITHDQEEAVTMADRICVMRSGRIEQVGTPTEVYYRPANDYVARFFGDNNFLHGAVAASGAGALVIETEAGRFHVGEASGSAFPGGAPAILLVRPEAIRIAPAHPEFDNRVRARVANISFVGPMTHVLLAPLAGGEPLLAKLPSSARGPSVAPGEDIEIGWRAADAHLVAAP
jgi:spermidine/putrescine transport system ATP-binding protein